MRGCKGITEETNKIHMLLRNQSSWHSFITYKTFYKKRNHYIPFMTINHRDTISTTTQYLSTWKSCSDSPFCCQIIKFHEIIYVIYLKNKSTTLMKRKYNKTSQHPNAKKKYIWCIMYKGWCPPNIVCIICNYAWLNL